MAHLLPLADQLIAPLTLLRRLGAGWLAAFHVEQLHAAVRIWRTWRQFR